MLHRSHTPVNLTNHTAGTATGDNFVGFDFAATTAGTVSGDSFSSYNFNYSTPGTATGDGFTPYNFAGNQQTLIVSVDGGHDQHVTLSSVCGSAASCASSLDSSILGASVAMVPS
eukprot:SAG31_NODE_5048_length_2778_cov_1.677118_3_plen_114_part_01